jgi:hypothetical protein
MEGVVSNEVIFCLTAWLYHMYSVLYKLHIKLKLTVSLVWNEIANNFLKKLMTVIKYAFVILPCITSTYLMFCILLDVLIQEVMVPFSLELF